MDDDLSNFLIFLDFSNLCIFVGELRDSFIVLFILGNSLIENFFDNLELKEEKIIKFSVLVVVNFKWKYQYLLNSEFCSNFFILKFWEMFSSQLSILVDDDEIDVVEDVEE